MVRERWFRTPTDIEQLTDYAFKSRVGLLFLDECLRREVELGPSARELHTSLTKRREATDAVVVRLARKLDEVAQRRVGAVQVDQALRGHS